jgi:ABC-type protease/lipase transport system fused ATPase/permease subunit
VFSTGGERINLRDADSIEHFVAGSAGVVAFFVVFVLLSVFSGLQSVFLIAAIAAVCLIVVSAAVFQIAIRSQINHRAKEAVEYRAMMDADKEMKIGEMQRANSNIPTVERKQ